MNNILNIYKPIGLTPLQLIDKLRESKPEYKDQKIGFAGRLDPLASGVMLLMIGEETKNREEHLGLPKKYEFEVLFGVSTDTYDALGILQKRHPRANGDPIKIDSHLRGNDRYFYLESKIRKFINNKLGKQNQQYPPYSSKTVNGKPLHWYARNNKLEDIEILKHQIEIYDFELINIQTVSIKTIKKIIIQNINSVTGDFRQKEILEKWMGLFEINKSESFLIAKLRLECSSGTYVRSLANELGNSIGCRAIALSILRTNVGKYIIDDSLRL